MQITRPSFLSPRVFWSPKNAGGATLASTRKGIIEHSEHFADLIIDVVPGTEDGSFPGLKNFDSLTRRFVSDIERKEIAVLNEKFDGSPAIALGYDAEGRPFVAYKRGVARGSKIIRTVKEARKVHTNPLMTAIYEDCIRYLRRSMARFHEKDVIFQADLLFTPSNGTKVVTEDAVTIKANPFGIEYTLPAGLKFYPFAAEAKIGLVVHSAMKRVIDPETGEVSDGEPLDDEGLIESFVKTIRSEEVFVIDPWSRRVQIDQGEDSFTVEKRSEILGILQNMHDDLQALDGEFRERWKTFLPQFKTFLNSSLKEGHRGGIYRAAAEGEPYDFELIVNKFREWIKTRSETVRISPKGTKTYLAPLSMPEEFEMFLFGKNYRMLCRYIRAYFDANRIQYTLKPHMREVYSSKLGGGKIEGIIITDGTTLVKLVDRLDFTMQNFSGEKKRKLRKKTKIKSGKKPKVKKQVPTPLLYRKWHAGAVFYLGKFQPLHAGHVANIGAAAAAFGPENVHVIASNKEPDLEATNWKDMGIAKRKKDLLSGDYVHVFSQELRQEIFRLGLPEGVNLKFADIAAFWSYLNWARARNLEGNIFFMMGQKEMKAGRYRQQLERFKTHLVPHPLPMQLGGMSGTQVRQAIKSLHERGDLASYYFLLSAFAFVPKKMQDPIIGQSLKEWAQAHAAVQSTLQT